MVDATNAVTESNENNNILIETINIICGKPDLIIINILLVPGLIDTGDPTDFYITIMNIGSGPARDSYLDFKFCDVWFDRKSIKGLEAGGDYMTVVYEDIDAGLGIAMAVADAAKQITEIDETNNELEKFIIPKDVFDEKTSYRPDATKIWVDGMNSRFDGDPKTGFDEKLKEEIDDFFQKMTKAVAEEIVKQTMLDGSISILEAVSKKRSTSGTVNELIDALEKYCENAVKAWCEEKIHEYVVKCELPKHLNDFTDLVNKEKESWENANLISIKKCMLDEAYQCGYIKAIADEIDKELRGIAPDALQELQNTMIGGI